MSHHHHQRICSACVYCNGSRQVLGGVLPALHAPCTKFVQDHTQAGWYCLVPLDPMPSTTGNSISKLEFLQWLLVAGPMGSVSAPGIFLGHSLP